MKKYLLAIGCVWMLTLGAAAQVNNYYVNATSGSDSNNGSQPSPWKTISHADSALTLGAGGTIVHVAACPSSTPCYPGLTTSHSGTANQRITFASDTKWGAKLKGGTWGASVPSWTMTGDYSTIQDFDITGLGSQLINIQCANCWVLGSHVHDNVGYVNPGDYSYNSAEPSCANAEAGIVVDSGHDHPGAVVSGNVVHDIGYSLPVTNPATGNPTPNPANCNFGVGIYMSSSSTVENNIIYRILVNGIVWNHRPTNMVTSNNVIFNISKAGQQYGRGIIIGVAENPGIANSVVQNNIIRDVAGVQGLGIQCYSGNWTNDFVRNNVIFNVTNGATTGCSGGMPATNTSTADPKFVNYNPNPAPPTISNGLISFSNADYDLQAGSPAIGAGTMSCASGGLSPCVASTDLAGLPRANPPSIGAIEFGSSASLPSAPANLTATVQ